jgi:hypothetical protein
MSRFECAREQEVAEALRRGWFDAAEEPPAVPGSPDDLRAHAGECEVCADVVLVAGIFRSERDVARHDVQVPAAGQVWWRAAIRARLEATQAAARPMTWVYGVAGACAAGLGAAVVRFASPGFTLDASAERWSHYVPSAADAAALLTTTMQRSLPFALLAAACLVLAPIALYLALSDE